MGPFPASAPKNEIGNSERKRKVRPQLEIGEGKRGSGVDMEVENGSIYIPPPKVLFCFSTHFLRSLFCAGRFKPNYAGTRESQSQSACPELGKRVEKPATFLVFPGARLSRTPSLSGTLDASLRPGGGVVWRDMGSKLWWGGTGIRTPNLLLESQECNHTGAVPASNLKL